MHRWSTCLVYILIFVCISLVEGCASITTQRISTAPLASTDTLYAWFEFDRIHLAETFHTAFRDQGLQVASSREEADLLLTGAYSATYDVVHNRFDWSQFKLVRVQTGQTLYTIQTGQGGLQSVESVVRKMVHEIKQLF